MFSHGAAHSTSNRFIELKAFPGPEIRQTYPLTNTTREADVQEQLLVVAARRLLRSHMHKAQRFCWSWQTQHGYLLGVQR